jgi:hypothetical protein
MSPSGSPALNKWTLSWPATARRSQKYSNFVRVRSIERQHYCGSVYNIEANGPNHDYIANGIPVHNCLCRFDLEYAPFPNWQQALCYGVVHNRKIHLIPVQIYPDGFHAEGEFYPRVTKRRRAR